MPFVALHDHLPELAKREARMVIVQEHEEASLPAGEYLFCELYCDEPECDCRRVLLMVWSKQHEQVEAVVNYGWEDPGFYARWLHTDDPEVVAELKGPSLNRGSPASVLAPAVLELFEQLLLPDRHYMERLKRHYLVFRRHVEARHRPGGGVRRIGRNEKCPCGSGRKFKICCGATGALTRSVTTRVDAAWSWKGDVDAIVGHAAAGVSHVIRLDSLVMFSTDTGDAWLLDPEEGVALMLARGGERLPTRIFETGTTFSVEWTHNYRVGDDTFLVTEQRSGQTRAIVGYQRALLTLIGQA